MSWAEGIEDLIGKTDNEEAITVCGSKLKSQSKDNQVSKDFPEAVRWK